MNTRSTLLVAATLVALSLAGCASSTTSVLTECPSAVHLPTDAAPTAPAAAVPPIPAIDTMVQLDDEPLKLGILVPLTGDLAAFGPSSRDAAKLAEKQINALGGVNGHPIEVIIGDSATDPTQALSNFNLLVQEGVAGVAGAFSSGVTGSILDAAIDNEVFVVTPASTSPALTARDNQGWFGRMPPSDALQGKVLAQVVYDAGCTTASILAVNNAYGVGLGDQFRETYESLGGDVLETINYDPKATTFSSQVQRAGQSGSDATILIGYPDTGTQIMREAFEKGTMADSVFFFSEGIKDEAGFVEVVGTKPDGTAILSGLRGTYPESSSADFFADAYQAEYGSTPNLFADGTYDAIILMALAAAHAGENSGPGIKASIMAVHNSPGLKVNAEDLAAALTAAHAGTDIDFVGVANDFDWDARGDPTEGMYGVWRVTDDLKIEVIQSGIMVA